MIEFENGLHAGFTSRPIPNSEFEHGFFEIVNTPPLGTGWVPEFPLDWYCSKYIYIPPVEYYQHSILKIIKEKPDAWKAMSKAQDLMYESIIRKIRQDMDRLVGSKCRMGGYMETGLMWVPEEALEFFINPNPMKRCLEMTMRATVGMVVI